MYNNTSFLTKV